jgi:hypothetical protein
VTRGARAKGRWVVSAIVVMGLGGWPVPVTAGARAPTHTATIDDTTWEVGQTITLTGTGCLDPDTGTVDDLAVYLVQYGFQTRTGSPVRPIVRATLAADGSFEGSGVLPQVVFDAPGDVEVQCFDRTLTESDPAHAMIWLERIDVTRVAPGTAPAAEPVDGEARFTG